MVKNIINLILQTSRVALRAIQKTAAEEAAAAKQARAQRLADKTKAAEEAKNNPGASGSNNNKNERISIAALKNQMQLKEATDILEIDIYPEMKNDEILAIQAKYDKMYANNKWVVGDRAKPTYLQSKVYRAKERVDTELRKSGYDLEGIYASAEK